MSINNTQQGRCVLTELLDQPSKNGYRTTLKALAIIDIFPAVLTVIANSILVLTYIKTRSLHNPSNVLLGTLCVCDILVGAVSQPLFLAMLFLSDKHVNLDFLGKAYVFSLVISMGMCFILLFIITIDRYLAICHPFVYERTVTCKKYFALVFVLCIYKILPPLGGWKFYIWYYVAITVSFSVGIKLCYARIYRVIQRQKRAISQVNRIGIEERRMKRKNNEEKTKTYTIAMLLGVLVISFIPILVMTITAGEIVMTNICNASPEVMTANAWGKFFLMLNSLLNPLVYCLRMKKVSRAVRNLLGCRTSVAVEDFSRSMITVRPVTSSRITSRDSNVSPYYLRSNKSSCTDANNRLQVM